MSAHDTHLAQRAHELYGNAAERLDPAVGTRLQAARLRALTAAHAGERRHFGSGARWLIPSGACAAVVLAAVTLWQPMQPPLPAGCGANRPCAVPEPGFLRVAGQHRPDRREALSPP